jgi:hypothetical protein
MALDPLQNAPGLPVAMLTGICVSDKCHRRELREVEHLVRQHRSLFPNDLIPTSLYGRFDRAADGIVTNE